MCLIGFARWGNQALAYTGEKMFNYFCERCGKKLNPKTMVSLEFDQRDNTYHDFGDVPENKSQGGFLFGVACAKKQIAEAKKIRKQRLQNS